MQPLIPYCVSAANIRKIILVYQSQRTVAYFMQIMRPVTMSYVPMTYPWHTCFVSMAYAWRTCCVAVANHSYVYRTCTAFLYGLSLVPVFFLLVKMHSKRTAFPLRIKRPSLPTALLSIARRRCDVCMANRSCYERRCGDFLKTCLNKLPHP